MRYPRVIYYPNGKKGKIRWVKEVDKVDKSMEGYTLYDTGEIVISSTTNPNNQGHILLHELIHQARPTLSEATVIPLAKELWQLLCWNRNVLDFIYSAARSKNVT